MEAVCGMVWMFSGTAQWVKNLGNCPGWGEGPNVPPPEEPTPPERNGSINIPPPVLKNKNI